MSRYLPTILFGLLVAGCGGAGVVSQVADEDLGEVIATVDGQPIGSKDFERAAARAVPAEGESLSDEERQEILDRLIAEKLLYKEALKKGLDQDPKVRRVMVNTLLREDVYTKVRNSDFSDEVLEAYYDEHPDEFVVPEKIQLKRILIRVTDERDDAEAKALAEKVRGELTSDPAGKFKDAAATWSEDPFKRRGGDVGFVSREGKPGLDSVVVEKAFGLPENTLSEVFKTEDGYNIILVEGKRESVARSFSQMKGSVLRKVKNEKLKELHQAYVADLKRGARISVDSDKLGAIEFTQTARPMVPPGVSLSPMAKLKGADGAEDGDDDGSMEDGE